jgi:hypothetical protein
MHPEIQAALVRSRHEDLLREAQAAHRSTEARADSAPHVGEHEAGPIPRRRRLLALVARLAPT